MKSSLVAVLMFFSVAAFSQSTGIHYESGTFEEALVKAQTMHRPLCVYLDMESNPVSKMVKTDFFGKDSVANWFNSKFINYKLEDCEGKDSNFVKSMDIIGYPYFAFYDETGRLIHWFGGAPTSAEEYQAVQEDVFTKEKTVAYFEDNYTTRKGDVSFVNTYFHLLFHGKRSLPEVVKDYILGLPLKQATTKENWSIITQACIKDSAFGVNYLVSNASFFAANLPANDFSITLDRVLFNYFTECFNAAIHVDDEKKRLETKLNSLGESLKSRALFSLNSAYCIRKMQFTMLCDLVAKEGVDYCSLISEGYLFFQLVESCADLESMGVIIQCLKGRLDHMEKNRNEQGNDDFNLFEVRLTLAKCLLKQKKKSELLMLLNQLDQDLQTVIYPFGNPKMEIKEMRQQAAAWKD